MNKRVLCVDDDPRILAGYQRNLALLFDLSTAANGPEALARLAKEEPFAVIVADMRMPRMTGIEFLVEAQHLAPDSVRIMLTGNADQQTAAEAVNAGQVFRFLTKPCPPEMLALALDAGIQRHHATVAEKLLLEHTLKGVVRVLAEVLAVVSPTAFGRGQQLQDDLRDVYRRLRRTLTWESEVAALLSQIGHVTLPPGLTDRLRAGASLSGAELDLVTGLPRTGANLLAEIPRLDEVARIILYQHKHFDGSGFPPDSVAGEAIPLASRVIKVLHDRRVLENRGTFRQDALALLRQRPGRYDPAVLNALEPPAEGAPANPLDPVPRRALRLADLRVGHVLASDVATPDGLVFAVAGNRISPVLLEQIRSFAIMNPLQEPLWVEA